MSIALVVTRGYGTGALSGSIKDVILSGFEIGDVIATTETADEGGPVVKDQFDYLAAADQEIIEISSIIIMSGRLNFPRKK